MPRSELDLLRESLESLPQAIVVFDQDDRYSFWNQKYADFYGRLGYIPQQGQTFETYLRQLLSSQQIPDAIGREEGWLRERMARHQLPASWHEHQIAESRWIRVEERQLSGGGSIGLRIDITEHKRREAELAYAAEHDALTGLANRVVLYRQLVSIAEMSDRDDPAALIYVDLDRFKFVNDTFGHSIGDKLLCQVARRLGSQLGPEDMAVRLGGDEFAVIVPHAGGVRNVERLATRIIRSVSEPYQILTHHIVIGASAGVAIIPLHGRDPDTVLQRADVALYRAKAEERGGCQMF